MATGETFHQPSVAVDYLLSDKHPPHREPCQSQHAPGVADACAFAGAASEGALRRLTARSGLLTS